MDIKKMLPTPRKIDRPFSDALFTPALITQPFGHVWPKVEPECWDYGDGEYGFHWASGAVEGAFHLGCDYALPCGTPLRSPADGIVRVAGADSTGFGNATWIDLGGGLWCLLAHQSAIHVQPGTRVTKDMIVGESGTSGNSTGCHLHFATCTPDGMGYYLFFDPAPYVNYSIPTTPAIPQPVPPTQAPTARRYVVSHAMYLRTAPALNAGHGPFVKVGEVLVATKGWSTNWRAVATSTGHTGWAFAPNLKAA